MERSANYNFLLPSSDVDDLADINQISQNFETIDEEMYPDQSFNPSSNKAQSGKAVAEAIQNATAFLEHGSTFIFKGGNAESGNAEGYATILAVLQNIQNSIYPVGSIHMSVNNVNPATWLGFGTWVQIKDRFLLSAGDIYTAGTTGGEAAHTLTEAELPSIEGEIFNAAVQGIDIDPNTGHAIGGLDTTGHFEKVFYESNWISRGSDGQTYYYPDDEVTDRVKFAFGSGNAHNNMPPYLVVYVWQRTA